MYSELGIYFIGEISLIYIIHKKKHKNKMYLNDTQDFMLNKK